LRRADRLDPRNRSRVIGCLLIAIAVTGCGGTRTTKPPSGAQSRDVAGRFAAAVLRGDAPGARALLVRTADQAALGSLVDRAAAPWKSQHASIRLPARRDGDRWTFRYTGRRTHRDGRFETERGNIVVFTGRSAGGIGVRYLVFSDVRRRFSTHHDAQLLPSNR
jgi:hypothetical protein